VNKRNNHNKKLTWLPRTAPERSRKRHATKAKHAKIFISILHTARHN